MLSKDDERKALEAIKKVLDTLKGKGDSYILTAFEGVMEDAERNILEDAAYSWKERAEHFEGIANTYTARCEGLEILKKEEYERRHNAEVRVENLQGELNKTNNELETVREHCRELHIEIEGLEDEIHMLKAELFDIYREAGTI